MAQKLFRDRTGAVKSHLSRIEGISFRESPLDLFILLARYKFAGRLLQPSDLVLDAGCGQGTGSVLLAKFAKRVVGVDTDSDLVESARREYAIDSVSFEVANVLDLGDYVGRFDAVVSMDVIEHFSEDDGRTVASNLASTLKDGGLMVLGTPNIRSQQFASERRRATHPHEYDHASLRRLLQGDLRRVMIFSMTDEVVSTGFPDLAWYLMAVGVK